MTNVEARPKVPLDFGLSADHTQGETMWRGDDSEEEIMRGKGDIVQTTTITVDYSGGKSRK